MLERISEIIKTFKKEARISWAFPKLNKRQVEKGKKVAKETASALFWIVAILAVIAIVGYWYYRRVSAPPPKVEERVEQPSNVVTEEIIDKMSDPKDAEVTIKPEEQSELLKKMSAPPVPPGKKAPQTPISSDILKGMSAPSQ